MSPRAARQAGRLIPALGVSVALIVLSLAATGTSGDPDGRSDPGSPIPPTAEMVRACAGHGGPVVHPSAGASRPHPEDDTTFDATGITWRPDLSTYPVNVDGSAQVCWLGGTIAGSIPADMTWELAHDYNQPCMRIVATGWMVVDGLRCDNTGDGLRPRETETGAQDVTMMIRNTYLTRIHDDCLENDGVIGGVLRDNLWDGCNTGISERPSEGQGGFAQPAGETLILDDMLIGLRVSPHESGPGENALFKWSDSANDLVIRCSIFKVDAVSLNGPETMAVPGTVDDRACPRHPSTVVWLGGGPYPGQLPEGMQVTSDLEVWTDAVERWKCEHGIPVAECAAPASPSATG
jgi:hypothetical protein